MEQNKYQDALIYTIKTDNGIYVGSTCDFVKRKTNHKSSCFNENSEVYNIKLYQNIRENGGEYSMEIYKLFPCNSKEELYIAEEKVRKELNPNLNSIKCFRTEEEKDEWFSQNKDNKKQYDKQYYEENKDHKKEYQKKYCEENKEKVSKRKAEYRNKNKESIAACNKEYREKNKEKISKQKSEYREKNKEEISKQRSEKIICKCGCKIRKDGLSEHLKSKKHIKLMNQVI